MFARNTVLYLIELAKENFVDDSVIGFTLSRSNARMFGFGGNESDATMGLGCR